MKSAGDLLLERSLFEAPLAILDLETTGLRPQMGHRVVEIAVVTASGLCQEEEYSQLLDPERPMDPAASAVNGISDSMLRGRPTFASVLPKIRSLLEGRILVAHNAAFDLSFLFAEYALAGEVFSAGPVLDTLLLSRRQYEFPSNSLESLAFSLGLDNPDPHRALGDAQTTYWILGQFVRELRGMSHPSVEDWISDQGGQAYDPDQLHHGLPDDHPISIALAQSHSLRIRYCASNGYTSTRVVRPLLCMGGYLTAWCGLRREQRTFRVDRIEWMELVD